MLTSSHIEWHPSLGHWSRKESPKCHGLGSKQEFQSFCLCRPRLYQSKRFQIYQNVGISRLSKSLQIFKKSQYYLELTFSGTCDTIAGLNNHGGSKGFWKKIRVHLTFRHKRKKLLLKLAIKSRSIHTIPSTSQMARLPPEVGALI